MAKITDMTFFALDHSPPMLAFAVRHIEKEGLADRVIPLVGDVHHLPFPDNSVDFMISRGSVLFWEDKPAAFGEIKRVLKKRGKSYIGCGMGSKELRDEIFEKMRQRDKNWDRNHQQRRSKQNAEELKQALTRGGITQFDIQEDDAGLWVYLER